MKKRDCPKQIAFKLHLNRLFLLRDNVFLRENESEKEYFDDLYDRFIDLWCPTTKDCQENQSYSPEKNNVIYHSGTEGA